MNKTEHLEWCKQRAIEYVNKDNISRAYASFLSDMNKHDETCDHIALGTGMVLLMSGRLSTQDQMKDWINGFG